jgi:hypothetical protein
MADVRIVCEDCSPEAFAHYEGRSYTEEVAVEDRDPSFDERDGLKWREVQPLLCPRCAQTMTIFIPEKIDVIAHEVIAHDSPPEFVSVLYPVRAGDGHYSPEHHHRYGLHVAREKQWGSYGLQRFINSTTASPEGSIYEICGNEVPSGWKLCPSCRGQRKLLGQNATDTGSAWHRCGVCSGWGEMPEGATGRHGNGIPVLESKEVPK